MKLFPTPMKTSAPLWREKTGESIPSLNRICAKNRAGRLLSALTNHLPAETIGRLNQKFFGRRAETKLSFLRPKSCVFSKNLRGDCPMVRRPCKSWCANLRAPRDLKSRDLQEKSASSPYKDCEERYPFRSKRQLKHRIKQRPRRRTTTFGILGQTRLDLPPTGFANPPTLCAAHKKRCQRLMRPEWVGSLAEAAALEAGACILELRASR
jgi:hypothetical protein